ncbi:hypothetical protein ACFL2D_00855 [Patescibacteria group bacterium]
MGELATEERPRRAYQVTIEGSPRLHALEERPAENTLALELLTDDTPSMLCYIIERRMMAAGVRYNWQFHPETGNHSMVIPGSTNGTTGAEYLARILHMEIAPAAI